MKLNVEYTSEWEWGDPDHIITTEAELNLNTGEVQAYAVDVLVEDLIKEYITYKNVDYAVEERDGSYYISRQDLNTVKSLI